jgi:hypothetical protein
MSILGQRHNLKKIYRASQFSMSGAKLLNATPVHYCNTLAVKHLHPSTFFVQRAEITTATVLQQILT